MPVMRKTRVEEHILPSTEDLPESEQATIKIEVPARIEDFSDVDTTKSQIHQNTQVIAKKIKEWNFTDEAGEPLPINVENLSSLDVVDYGFLTFTLGLHKLQQVLARMQSKKKPS